MSNIFFQSAVPHSKACHFRKEVSFGDGEPQTRVVTPAARQTPRESLMTDRKLQFHLQKCLIHDKVYVY